VFAAFGRGDIAQVLERLSEDVQWSVTGPRQTPFAGTRRGRAQVAEFFAALAGSVEIQRFEPQEFIAQGGQVVVVGVETLRFTATGSIAQNPWVMVFTLREGTIVRYREFDDTYAVAAGAA
jgi:ketosteroid isomerase-like protein